MTWKLTFPEQHPHFWHGKDDSKRSILFLGLIDKYMHNHRCLQVGVMSTSLQKLGPSFISLDLYDQRPCIDVREDLANTSFPDSHFDFVVCNAILEHVKDPFKCAKEIHRILKPGGEVWAEIPFVQPYHPYKTYNEVQDGILPKDQTNLILDQDHGGDYWRFTPQGLKLLFKDLTLKDMLMVGDGGLAYYGCKI